MPVALWHEKNAKLSMGAKGLDEYAELVVENGQGTLYLSAILTDNNGLYTSLMHFFYQEGGQYQRATSADWQLVLPTMQAGRPSIFSMPLLEKEDFYPVLVDPQVIFMGGTPIPARLKVEWGQLEKIAASDLQARALAAPAPNVGGAIWLSVSGIEACIAGDGLNVVPDLSAANVLPDEMNKLKAAVGVSQGSAWKLSLNAPLTSIANEQIYDIDQLRVPLTNVPMRVYFPKSANEKTACLYAFAADGSKKKIPLVEEGGRWRADGVTSSTLLLAEGVASAAAPTNKATSSKSTASATPARGAVAAAGTATAHKTAGKPAVLNGTPLNSTTVQPTGENEPTAKDDASFNEQNASNKILAPQENKGVIATVFAIFLALIGAGITAWRKYYPIFSEELARYRYLQVFERKVLK